MGTCCLNNKWLLGLCVRARVCSQRAAVKTCSACEGLTFICGTMSHFQASHQQLFVCAGGFLAHISLKCKWTFPLFFLSSKERDEDKGEALFVCRHTMTFLLISGPAAR